MSEKKEIQVELCSDSGCGLIVVQKNDKQHRISLMPDEVLEALETDNSELQEFFADIEPSFEEGMESVGIEAIADELKSKKLPPYSKEHARRLKEEFTSIHRISRIEESCLS